MNSLCHTICKIIGSGTLHNWFKPHDKSETEHSSGTGFLYRCDKETFFIMTAFHVVSEMTQLYAIFSFDKKKRPVIIRGSCPTLDVAILTMEPFFSNFDPYCIPLQTSNTVRMFDSVIVAGFPNCSDSLKISQGIVSGRDKTLLQVDASINGGNSGGPLLLTTTTHQQVAIGIVVSHQSTKQGIGYARPMNEILVHLTKMEQGETVFPSNINCKWIQCSQQTRRYLHPEAPTHGALISCSLQQPFQKNDILLEIDSFCINEQGEIVVSWWPEPISIKLYLWGKPTTETCNIKYWSMNEKTMKTITLLPSPKKFPLQKRFAQVSMLDYEPLGGFVVTPLIKNHVKNNEDYAKKFAHVFSDIEIQLSGMLVVVFVFPESIVNQEKTTIAPMDVIKSVNGIDVFTMEEYRLALKKAMTMSDNIVCWECNDGFYASAVTDEIVKEYKLLQKKYSLVSSII